MKAISRFFSIVVTVIILNTVLPQSLIQISDGLSGFDKVNLIEHFDEDCYTYERVFINGFWWIYVYDCEGILIKAYVGDED